jgi:hypothetical protein
MGARASGACPHSIGRQRGRVLLGWRAARYARVAGVRWDGPSSIPKVAAAGLERVTAERFRQSLLGRVASRRAALRVTYVHTRRRRARRTARHRDVRGGPRRHKTTTRRSCARYSIMVDHELARFAKSEPPVLTGASPSIDGLVSSTREVSASSAGGTQPSHGAVKRLPGGAAGPCRP